MQAFSNELNHAMTAQVTYVGTRGLRLYRFVGINQAQIATLTRPVTNAVTGDVITTNAPDDAAASTHARSVDSRILRPERTDAQSTYHSLQVSIHRSMSRGLQFQAAYTFSKSIDDAPG